MLFLTFNFLIRQLTTLDTQSELSVNVPEGK
jgi:hypothetical protein